MSPLTSKVREYSPAILAGDPNPSRTSTATQADLVLAWLASLPLDQRRMVLMRARSLPRVAAIIPNVAATIPASATLEQKANVLGGYLLDALALHITADDATKDDVYAMAESLATRLPLQGDPKGSVPMEVAAGLVASRDPGFAADVMLAAIPDSEKKRLIELEWEQDGNLPMHGGIFDKLKKLGSFLFTGKDEVDATSPVGQLSAAATAAAPAALPTSSPIAKAVTDAVATELPVSNALSAQLSAMRASLDALSKDLETQTANYETTREEMVRAEWALAFLTADDEVVKALVAVKPDMTNVTSAVSTVFSLVESLRQNTNLTKFGTLSRALSSMFGKAASSIPGLVTGDPGADLVASALQPNSDGLASAVIESDSADISEL